MNRIGKTSLLFLALGLGFRSSAVTPDTRYDTIVERNIFRLTSPPPPAPPPVVNEALERDIVLTGIAIVAGQKKAWFIIRPKAGSKDPQAQYMSLGENERQEFLEVLSISEALGEVKVKNSGSDMVLSFKNNSNKALPGAGPVPVAGVPLAPAASVIAGANAAGNINPAPGGRTVTALGGISPLPQANQGNVQLSSGGNFQPNAGGLTSIPSRNVRTSPQSVLAGAQATGTQRPLDPAAQRALMEIQQEHAKRSGQTLPPLPPLPQ